MCSWLTRQTDSHLWADTYDRKLTDIFGVESEIAKGIAESLQAKLTGREEQALAVKPTNNPEAYDAYLRGLAFEARSRSPRSLSTRESHRVFMSGRCSLTRNFAIAWARLSRADAHSSTLRTDDTHYRRSGATRRKVLWRMRRDWSRTRLKPCSPWVIINTGCCVITGLAKTTFERVSKMLPGSSEAPDALGLSCPTRGTLGSKHCLLRASPHPGPT